MNPNSNNGFKNLASATNDAIVEQPGIVEPVATTATTTVERRITRSEADLGNKSPKAPLPATAPPGSTISNYRVSQENEIADLDPVLVIKYEDNDEVLLCKLSVCNVYWAADLKVSDHYVCYRHLLRDKECSVAEDFVANAFRA